MILRPCIAKAAIALRPRPPSLPPSFRVAAARTMSTKTATATPIPSTKKLESIRNQWRIALETGSPRQAADALTRFRITILKVPEGAQRQTIREAVQVDSALLFNVIKILSKDASQSGELETIFRESESTFGVKPTPELLLAILQTLVDAGENLQAFQILKSFDKRKGQMLPYPSDEHWRCVMKGFAREGNIDQLRACLYWMYGRFPLPDNLHYQCLLEGMLNSDNIQPDDVQKVLDDMYRCGLQYDKGIHETLASLVKKDSMVFAQFDYERRFKNPKRRPPMVIVEQWVKELSDARRSARSAFEQKLKLLHRKGFRPGPSVLSKIIRANDVSTVEELRYLTFCLGTPADVLAWSCCMQNVLRSQGWKAALEAYGHAKGDGVQPDAKMLDSVIRAMLQVPLKQLSDDLIDRIVMLLDDLGERADLAIYNLVLHALTSSTNETKYFPIALDVLRRMKARDIKMDVMTATAAAQILIRSATSFEEAKSAYEEVRSLSDPPLDLVGYRAVLSAFCRVELRVNDMDDINPDQVEYEGMRLSIPPAATYFEIVKDMRDRGFPISSHEYCILIARYAMLATRARSLKDPAKRVTVLDSIRSDIEETHRRISVDAGLEVDGILMNRLMDAYNRVDSLADAMRMWTMLVTMGKVSPASISIVFDTVGHSRSIVRADAVFAEIKRLGFKLNVWNWNAWVECLCRLYRRVEAADVVRKEMPAHGINPNAETWQVLTSFGFNVESFKNFPPSMMASLDAYRRTMPQSLDHAP